jgi:transposase
MRLMHTISDADAADSRRHRATVAQTGNAEMPTVVTPIARSDAPSAAAASAYATPRNGCGQGRRRWPVEQTFALLHRYRRLATCYHRTIETHQALVSLPDDRAAEIMFDPFAHGADGGGGR